MSFASTRVVRAAAVLLGGVAIAAASMVATGGEPGAAAAPPHAAPADLPAVVVDNIAFDELPGGLGTMSQFHYDYSGTRFVSDVWESHDASGWSVDLDVQVMRGAHLKTKRGFRRWFVAYEARDPEPTYIPFRVHGHPGWLAKDQLFWLIRPGLAVSVQLDSSTWPTYDVVQTGWSAHWLR